MSRPRLLFVVESGTDVRLVEGLAEHFELSLIVRKIEGGVEISHPPVVDIPIKVGPPRRAAFGRFVLRELLRCKGQIDIVLVQGYGVAALACNAAQQLTGVATMMLVCSPVEAYYGCRLVHPNGRPYQKHEAILLNLFARANALTGGEYVVLSNHLAEVVQRAGAHRVHNVPIYGVDTQIFKPSTEPKSVLKARMALPTSGTLIFFSSRIAPEKDSETLLRAVQQLLAAGHDLWLLHRSGGYKQFLIDAKSFGIADRVIASDAVHPHRQLPLDYQASDICVQASREEGLGFSPLEALACETPVIATAVGGLRETIIDGQTGWTYPVGDNVALSRRLVEVISNPGEGARRAKLGRQLVCDRFDRKLVFSRFADLVQHTMAVARGNG